MDIRPGSPQFGRWTAVTLSSDNKRQFYIPPGFAHGFCVLSDTALFTYKCTDLYHPECDGGIRWDDPDIGIDWPLEAIGGREHLILSDKDLSLPSFAEWEKSNAPAQGPTGGPNT